MHTQCGGLSEQLRASKSLVNKLQQEIEDLHMEKLRIALERDNAVKGMREAYVKLQGMVQ